MVSEAQRGAAHEHDSRISDLLAVSLRLELRLVSQVQLEHPTVLLERAVDEFDNRGRP